MDVFNHIIETKKWQHAGGSLCGPGTDHSRGTIDAMNILIEKFGFRNWLDIACGDGTIMHEIFAQHNIKYHGIDCVEPLLKTFRDWHHDSFTLTKKIVLQHGDARFADLPQMEIALVRDVLFHLPFLDALQIISNIRKSGTRFMLTTTFPAAVRNFSIDAGDWYPINIALKPFELKPSIMFDDGYGGFQKYLALIDLAPF